MASTPTTPRSRTRPSARVTGPTILAAVLFAILGTIITAPAAAADGVGPTNFRSEITGIQPETGSVDVRVVGSDAFLEVSAEPGTTVGIPGYEGEPYLRIDADGSIWRNDNSPARFINDSRSGNAPIPKDLPDPSNPDWQRVGSGGTVAWHDHRIHWMSTETPTTGGDGAVMEWQVPLIVDGTDIMVTGELFHAGNQFPWPLLVTVAVASLVLLAALRSKRLTMTMALFGSSLAAVITTLLVVLADPPDAGRSPLAMILAGAAVVVSIAALVPGKRPPISRLATSLAVTALLVGWLIPLIGVFWMPYVPTAAPISGLSTVTVVVVRVLTAVVAGTAIGSVITAAARPTAFLDEASPQAV